MERKLKLAKLILVQSESLKICSNVEGSLTLAEEITKDAVELSKLIHEENNEALPKENDMLTYNELDAAQQAIAIQMAFEDVVVLVTEGFLAFDPQSTMSKGLSLSVENCKLNPYISLKTEVSIQCFGEIMEMAKIKAEETTYHRDLFNLEVAV
jgi:hypothetical protein